VGYHYIVRRNGAIETGRPESEVGAHVAGYNSKSIGVCWVGGRGDDDKPKDNRTEWQVQMLTNLIFKLKKKYPLAKIAGHYEFDDRKACPCFDVQKEFGYLNNYENENEIEEFMEVAERQKNQHRAGGNANSTSHSGFHPEPDAGGTDGVFANTGRTDWRFRPGAQGSQNQTSTAVFENKTEQEVNSLVKARFTIRIALNKIVELIKKLVP
jgi:N-acetylmuramoyl-L-alanine amidase